MFNVLIEANGTAWETDQLMRFKKDRFKFDSGSESEAVDLAKPETLKLLEDVATILMYEETSEGPHVEMARYGFVRNIKVARHELVFTFTEHGRFPRAVVHDFAHRLGLHGLNTTQWTIKDAGIPSAMMRKLIPIYDVVFSFAGEDRKYVKQVADYLRKREIRIFFDEYEQAHLWGKDLAEHLGLIYRQSGHHCVMFISEHYIRKMWTKHERRFAVSRALEEAADYILPARFDKTEVPGVPSTIHYIELENMKPSAFGRFILKKLGRDGSKKGFSA